MTTDWLLRVGDGENFINSSRYRIWGIQSTSPANKHFIRNVNIGDRLWFVKSNSNGKIIAVATYQSLNKRELGPLVNFTMTNQELGWSGEGPDWTSDTEIHYSDMHGLSDCELLTHIKGPTTIRKYDDKCRVNLSIEYNNIIRYSRMTFEM
jgi:hypothetical protein